MYVHIYIYIREYKLISTEYDRRQTVHMTGTYYYSRLNISVFSPHKQTFFFTFLLHNEGI